MSSPSLRVAYVEFTLFVCGSIMMRPKHEPGTFHLGIIGQNFDPVDLSTDPLKFTESFHKYTGRRDIVLKNFTALTYWKSV